MYKVQVLALKRVLTNAAQVIDKRSSYPTLSNVHLTARGSGLLIESTDLEVSHSEVIEVTAIEGTIHWTAVVNCKQLLTYIKGLSGECTLALNGTAVLLVNGASFQGILSEDYPALNKIPEGTPHQLIETNILLALLRATEHATSQDVTRYHLCGVYLESTVDGWKVTSTDGHRLAHHSLSSITHSNKATQGKSWILSNKAVKTLITRLSKFKGLDVTLYVDGPWLHVVSEGTLSIRAIGGKYPNYSQLIPTKNKNNLVVNGEMVAACKRLAPMTGKSNGVNFKFGINMVTLTAFNVDEGTKAEEKLNIPCDFELEMGLNVDYLIDALDAIGGEVKWQLNDKISPIVLSRPNGPMAVIMPMRI